MYFDKDEIEMSARYDEEEWEFDEEWEEENEFYDEEEQEEQEECLADETVTGFYNNEREAFNELLNKLESSIETYTSEIKPCFTDDEPDFVLSEIITNLASFDALHKDNKTREQKERQRVTTLKRLVQNDIEQKAIAMGSLDND
ncbi:MAG: hypothetical protein KBT03_03175 [Bacteroidales bacterium]|nr:hypothetical protein [Candidatus Scybalousia scybalohippi]